MGVNTLVNKRCQYWTEYESTSGVVCYCHLAAFSQDVDPRDLDQAGCSKAKREECRAKMMMAMGFAAVPEERKTPRVIKA
jgi:hypothetical protein